MNLRTLIRAFALAALASSAPVSAQVDAAARGLATQALTTRPYKNLSEYGVQYGVQADQSAAINAALLNPQHLPLVCSGTVYVSSPVVLQSNSQLFGTGGGPLYFNPNAPGCTIRAMPGYVGDVMHIAAGQVQRVVLKDLRIFGDSATAGQNGLVVATGISSASGSSGGLWNSDFENIWFLGFMGTPVAFLGDCASGYTDPTPVQWMVFKNIYITVQAGATGAGFYASGQVEHVSMDDVQITGPFYNPSTGSPQASNGMYIGQSYASNCKTIGPLGTGTTAGTVMPNNWSMSNVDIENVNQALIVDAARDIHINTMWAEGNSNFIKTQANAFVVLDNSHIANSAQTGGYVAVANSCSELTWQNTVPIGTTGSGFKTDGCGTITMGGLTGGLTTTNVTITTSISTAGNVPQLRGAQQIFTSCTASGASYSGFNSDLGAGTLFTVSVSSASAYPCTLNSLASGVSSAFQMNLGNGVSTVTLNAGDTAVFVRSVGPRAAWEYLGKH